MMSYDPSSIKREVKRNQNINNTYIYKTSPSIPVILLPKTCIDKCAHKLVKLLVIVSNLVIVDSIAECKYTCKVQTLLFLSLETSGLKSNFLHK